MDVVDFDELLQEGYSPASTSSSSSSSFPAQGSERCEACVVRNISVCSGVPCHRCASLNVKCKKYKPRHKIESACIVCQKQRRKCEWGTDATRTMCFRCEELGVKCERKEPTKSRRKSNSSSSSLALTTARPAPVENTTKLFALDEHLADVFFVSAMLENFSQFMGVLFEFGREEGDHWGGGPVADLYSTPLRLVRTDSMLTCVFRASGMVDLADRHFKRAQANSPHLFIADGSSESISSLMCFSLASMGLEKDYSDLLFKVSVAKKMDKPLEFESDYHFFLIILEQMMHPVVKEVVAQTLLTVYGRLSLRADHVRNALASVGEKVVKKYGPWDWCEFRGTGENVADAETAMCLLREMEKAEEKMESLLPMLRETQPKLVGPLLERFRSTAFACRTALYFIIGDFDMAKSMGFKTVETYHTVAGAIWIGDSIIDLIHVIDISISMKCLTLFEAAVKIVRRFSAVVPMCEILGRALAGIPSTIFNADEIHTPPPIPRPSPNPIEILDGENSDVLDEIFSALDPTTVREFDEIFSAALPAENPMF